jgi:hypothetical protein
LSIEQRFEIVENLIQTYANAHCVITSRLYVVLPCLTQKTPVLLTLPQDGIVDINDRIGSFLGLFCNNHYEDFRNNRADYDFENPPQNSDAYFALRDNLIAKCNEFICNCENGNIINKYPFTDYQRKDRMIEILQEKIQQLKHVVDDKNSIIINKEQAMLDLQSKLRKHETFNEWKNFEHFNDWSERTRIMSKWVSPDTASLLDLGCGEMYIRKYINQNVKYYGCDYKKRDSNTIVCDLAVGEFPDIQVDTIFIAGCLEFLGNWKNILEQCSRHCKQIIMSYSTIEASPNRSPLWVNEISDSELKNYVLSLGFKLRETEMPDSNSMAYNFIKK